MFVANAARKQPCFGDVATPREEEDWRASLVKSNAQIKLGDYVCTMEKPLTFASSGKLMAYPLSVGKVNGITRTGNGMASTVNVLFAESESGSGSINRSMLFVSGEHGTGYGPRLLPCPSRWWVTPGMPVVVSKSIKLTSGGRLPSGTLGIVMNFVLSTDKEPVKKVMVWFQFDATVKQPNFINLEGVHLRCPRKDERIRVSELIMHLEHKYPGSLTACVVASRAGRFADNRFDGLYKESRDRSLQREENQAAGRGNITHLEVVSEQSHNRRAGHGLITNAEMTAERKQNEDAGRGCITHAQLEKARLSNGDKGLGLISDNEVQVQQTANGSAGLGYFTNYVLERQRVRNNCGGFGAFCDIELKDQVSANETNGRGKICNAEVARERVDNTASGAGAVTNVEAKTQRALNGGKGYGKLTDAEVQLQQKAHAKAGLGSYTTSELTEWAVEKVSIELADELKAKGEIEKKLRSTWFEHFGAGYVHGSADAPWSFPPGPIPRVPPPSEVQIKSVALCMATDCQTSFGIFTRRHTCNVCGAITCSDCLEVHCALGQDDRACSRCRTMCDEWMELHRNAEVEWATKEATAQVAAARDALVSSDAAVEVYVAHQLQREEAEAKERQEDADRAAKQAAERAALKLAREQNEQAERADRLAAEEAERGAEAAAIEEKRAREQAAIEKERATASRVAARKRSIATIEASEALQASDIANDFEVPKALETMVDAADELESNLHQCNEHIRQNILVDVIDGALSSTSLVEKIVAERNQSRLDYVKAATELLKLFHECDAISLCGNAAATYELACALRIKLGATEDHTYTLTGASAKDVLCALRILHQSWLAEQDMEQAELILSASDAVVSFPEDAVYNVLQWLQDAAGRAEHRFQTIKKVVDHHQVCLEGVQPWTDPEAKSMLLVAAKNTRKAKKRARKAMKVAILQLDTAGDDDSDDDSEDGAAVSNVATLESAVKSAKVTYAKAIKAELEMQAKVAAAVSKYGSRARTHARTHTRTHTNQATFFNVL